MKKMPNISNAIRNLRLPDVATAMRVIVAVGQHLSVLLLPVVAVGGMAIALYSMWQSIYNLGTRVLVVNPAIAPITATSFVAVMLCLIVATVLLASRRKFRTLLIVLLLNGLWLFVGLLMALLEAWLSNQRLPFEPALLSVAAFIYSGLPALQVVPLVLLWESAAHERDGQYANMLVAFKAIGFSFLKVALTVAMFTFEAFFGVGIGVQPIAAIFAAVLNAVAFSTALSFVEEARLAKSRAGVNLWGAISFFYAVVMFLIAAEAIMTFSRAAGTSLANQMAFPEVFEQVARWAFVSSIGISALLLSLTFWASARRDTDQPGRSVWTAIADGVSNFRQGVIQIRDAAVGRPALPPSSARGGGGATRPVVHPPRPPAVMPEDDSVGPPGAAPEVEELLRELNQGRGGPGPKSGERADHRFPTPE